MNKPTGESWGALVRDSEPTYNEQGLPPNLISTNVNTPSGGILLVCTYMTSIAAEAISQLSAGREVYSFCPELSHLDVLGLKLTTMFRIGKVTDLVVLTKDGSPHSMQIPLMVQEAAENTNFPKSKINYFAYEDGGIHPFRDLAVRKARHYSAIEEVMDLAQLRKVVEILRAPGGCPNDRAETWMSVVDHLREETEEVAEAVAKNDIENLEEEIGDLLFNIYLLAGIGEDAGLFSIESIAAKCAKKMIDGHPKVFTGEKTFKY
ncbi:MAG: MazG nucleotide pyrophosphohydrolase domain-containing protein [Sulfitobacter sp.]